ncbi:MAG: hypothetical protein AB1714_02750 [Acidobacteriota bacterium]
MQPNRNDSRTESSGHLAVIESVLRILVLLTVISLAALSSRVVCTLATSHSGLPSWDMAVHGYEGVRLAQAIKAGQLLEFLYLVDRQSLWPPVFPLLECPAFVAAGYDYAVPRALVSVLFSICVLVAYWAGTQLDDDNGQIIGVTAASMMCMSPIFLEYGTLTMLEVPGALLLLLAVGFYFRHGRNGETRSATAACLAGVTLFFCKYNYGVFFLFALLANELSRRMGSLGGVRWRHHASIVVRRWLKPFPLFITALIIVIIAIQMTGGWILTIGGWKLSIRGVANPIYVLLVSTLIWLVHRYRKNSVGFKKHLERMRPIEKRILAVVVVPILIWMIDPRHLRDFVGFMTNRSSGIPMFSQENLLFYPRAFLSEYSPGQIVGLVVLSMGIAALLHFRRADIRLRFLLIAEAFAILGSISHPFKEARFFFMAAPILWLGCGVTLASALRYATQNMRATARRLILLGVSIAIAMTSTVGIPAQGPIADRLDRDMPPRNISPVLDQIARIAESTNGSVLLGTWNWFSPALVAWHCRIRFPEMPGHSIPKDISDLTDDQSPEGVADAISSTGGIVKILILHPIPPAQAWFTSFMRENGWLEPVGDAIMRDPRFDLRESKRFPKAGYELLVFRKIVRGDNGENGRSLRR